MKEDIQKIKMKKNELTEKQKTKRSVGWGKEKTDLIQTLLCGIRISRS